MRIFLKMILVAGGLLLVGCGGGSDSGGSSSTHEGNKGSKHDNHFEGKNQKAIITEANSIKFIRAANYIYNLTLEDIPLQGKNIEEENHINRSTGLGYILFKYTDVLYNNTLMMGTRRIDVLALTQTKVNIKIEVNFIFKTNDNNVSLHQILRGTIVDTEDGEKLKDISIDHYYIYDKKYKEHIDILDFDTNPKLYVGSEGYVLLDKKSDDFEVYGENNTKLKIIVKPEETLYETRYRDPSDPVNGEPEPYQEKIYEAKDGQGIIEYILNGVKQTDLYFVQLQVSEFEPPKFYEQHGNTSLLEYAFYTWHTKYKLLNSDVNNMQINVEWFVNDVKVDTPMQYELPLGSFSGSDTVKVIVTATHGDVSITRETILDSDSNSYNVASGAHAYPGDTYEIEYRTNTLEFDLDLLAHEYFKNIDVEHSDFSWNMLNISSCQSAYGACSYIVKQDTKYQKIPRLSAKSYGDLYEPLYLMIYEGHEVKVVRFNITLMRGTSGIGDNGSGDIIASIEEANLTNDATYIATNKVAHIDIDNNGLDDIIYTSTTDTGSFLNISYQNEKRVFTLEKIQNDGGLFLGDYDGDGVKEAFMFGATENASQLISLEKGNLHVIKDINLANTLNILNVYTVADMNNDGKDDLVITNNQEDKLYIYENLDDLTQKRLIGASVCRGIQAIKDINSDGLNDIICKPRRKETHDASTDLFSSELFIDYFLQELNGTFILNTKEYTLLKDVSFNKATQTRVYGASMLDESNIAVSIKGGVNDTLYTCDLMNADAEPSSKTDTNSYYIDAFLAPTDVNHDGKVDLLYFRDYGQGELGIFYQLDNFSFDADYRVEMNTYNKLTNRFLTNAFLDDIDNDGSLEIVTINGENQFSYINLK